MKLLLPLLLLLAMLPPSHAAVTLLSPADSALFPSQNIDFRFNVSEAASNCTLSLNSAAVFTTTATQNAITTISREITEGNHSWGISCATNSSTISSPGYALAVDITPPEVTLLTGFTTFNSSTVELRYLARDANLRNCTLRADVTGSLQPVKTNLTPASGQNSSFTLTLQDGTYRWNVACADHAAHTGSALFSNTITIDTTPPSLTSIQPSSIVTSPNTVMSMTSTEQAECRYSTSAANYPAMTTFTITGSTEHKQFLNFLSDGTYAYYVSCMDGSGNQMDAKAVKITVHLPPTARIVLSDNPPVKAGIIDVTLLTSKALNTVPTLTYDAAGLTAAVALTGDGGIWKGKMLIPDTGFKGIATFSFIGTDLQGYGGTTITEGRSFIIDTNKPAAPARFQAEQHNDTILLNWYAEDDDLVSYQLYRSTRSGVTPLDYYMTVNGTGFVDASAQDRTTYYYRVAAIDEAENVGPLSPEIFATASAAVQATQTPTPASPALPPPLVRDVEASEAKVESSRLTAANAQNLLKELPEKEKKLAEQLGILSDAQSAVSRLEQLKGQLAALKEQYRETGELHPLLTSIEDEAKKLEQGTVRNVAVSEHTEYINTLTKEAVLRALSKAEALLDLPADNIGYAARDMKDTQDLRMVTSLDLLTLTHTDGTTREQSVVTHTFTYLGPSPVQDSIVIVFIPKSIASSAKDMQHLGSPPEIVEDDPVLKWGFLVLDAEPRSVSYALSKKLSADTVPDIQLVPLLNLNALAGVDAGPTGFAVLSGVRPSTSFWFILTGVLIVAALAGYYFLSSPPAGSRQRPDALSAETLETINKNLSAMQMEIDDKLYPIVLSLRSAMLRKEHVSGEQLVSSLIERGTDSLETGNAAKAASLYSAIQLIYQALPPEQKARLGPACISLHRRIIKARKK